MQRGGAVDWKLIREMILAWVVTLPAGALFGVLAYALLLCIFGMHKYRH
jgi:phosphate/sulfate permease